MKRVLIQIVNYKSDEELLRLLSSIQSALHVEPNLKAKIIIWDNSLKDEYSHKKIVADLGSISLDINYHRSPANLGYFGALPCAQKYLKSNTDFVIYCNADIEFDVNFLQELYTIERGSEDWILAPAITVKNSDHDQNPKYHKRISKSKLTKLKYIFSTNLSFIVYQWLGYIRELIGSHTIIPNSKDSIYAAHGSIFVFVGSHFFSTLPSYPCFLYGEELFVAEEALLKKIKSKYVPKLLVYDDYHASTKFLSIAKKRQYYLTSIKYILDTYY